MRITFKSLEQFARERGYTVERRGRMIEWYHNNDHEVSLIQHDRRSFYWFGWLRSGWIDYLCGKGLTTEEADEMLREID